MFASDSVLVILMGFLFGDLDKHFAYFLFIYMVDSLLNRYLQKQQYYLEHVTHSPYCLKTISPLFILVLSNVLDQQIADYYDCSFRNMYAIVYTFHTVKKVSPYLSDETFFFRKTVNSIVSKLNDKINTVLNKT